MAAGQSMLPADWEELAPLLDSLLDAPPSSRSELFATLSGGDAIRRSRLEHLVAECERDAPLFDRSAFERFDQLLEDPAPALPELLSGRYQTGRELGHGGMARVYLARDLKHQREVAVKVIRPELAESLGREQFLREIAIAARLRHPNIVPLFDSGDDGGALYFVMPYEAGPSLREKVAGGPLPVADVVSVLRDVSRALAYAHQHDIVHRDVKPDNVMLSSGAAVVTDFGIAKALRIAQVDAPVSGLLQTGAMGTPAYMAPEQAAGDASSDHRADIYSFGCMAYELLTGKPPFIGTSAAEVLAAHAIDSPRPLAGIRPDIPPQLAQLVTRCLEKRPEARPQTASELVSVLDGIAAPNALAAQSGWRMNRLAVAALALVVVLGAASVFKRSSDQSESIPTAGPVTVAVLPITNAGGDSAHAILAEALSTEIASSLVKVPWVRIMSRRGVSNYRGQKDLDYTATGRELGARYLLTGSAREAAGREIITLQLISAADGSTYWADRFDGPTGELEAERDQIALAISTALRPLAGADVAQRTARPAQRRTSSEAYFYRVQAQQWLDRRGVRNQSSADYFRRAIAVDSNYAEAYSGLSLALALFPYFQDVPPAVVRDELVASANRALALDSTLSQPHVALGMAYEQNNEWDRAEAEFVTALRLDSHDVEARVQYARYLMYRERVHEAMTQLQAARQDDPASALVLGFTAYTYYLLSEPDSARVIIERALQSNASSFTALNFAALIKLADGDSAAARALALRSRVNWPNPTYVVAATEPEDSARKRARLVMEHRPRIWMANTIRAFAMMAIRDTAKALDAFEDATRAKEIWPALDPHSDRTFDVVRDTPRFRRLLAQVGLRDSTAGTAADIKR